MEETSELAHRAVLNPPQAEEASVSLSTLARVESAPGRGGTGPVEHINHVEFATGGGGIGVAKALLPVLNLPPAEETPELLRHIYWLLNPLPADETPDPLS